MNETPDWTLEEELMCIKILNEVASGKCRLFTMRGNCSGGKME